MFSLPHRRFSQNSTLFDLFKARTQPWRKFPEQFLTGGQKQATSANVNTFSCRKTATWPPKFPTSAYYVLQITTMNLKAPCLVNNCKISSRTSCFHFARFFWRVTKNILVKRVPKGTWATSLPNTYIYIYKHDEIMANSRPALYEKLSFRPRPGRLNTFLQEERKETIT